ncbi:MAG: M23 family metallopeptidase [Lysobacter spongiicola]|nr:M23 family metallopeptidase [Lysobacter spongiicola]
MKLLDLLKSSLLLLALAAPTAVGATGQQATSSLLTPETSVTTQERTLAEGRQLSRLFLEGDTDTVWDRMGPDMRQGLGSPSNLAGFRKQVGDQLGEETAVQDEAALVEDGIRVYRRVSTWSQHSGPILVTWAFDDEGMVVGFFVRPQPQTAASTRLDYQTRARLRLPFGGQWKVFWGGRTLEQNYHAESTGQRFAYDFVREVDGSSHSGNGAALEDYHCWGEPILAPAPATVVAAVDGLPDQPIGTTNAQAPAGNHVMLDLGRGEYALLAHFQQDSLQVATGDEVAAGDVLGRCGNSGNTSEPHLHFHLQDSPVFGQGSGLPAYFNDYIVDGKAVARGEPLRHQLVEPAGE